jgi:hypothetical protein
MRSKTSITPPKGSVPVSKLTPRQKFHKFYREEYLDGANKLIADGVPHHPDKHAMLGYETNTIMQEIQTVSGKIELVPVKGLCPHCSISQKSAKESYEIYKEGRSINK